jgi:hypothetical protein
LLKPVGGRDKPTAVRFKFQAAQFGGLAGIFTTKTPRGCFRISSCPDVFRASTPIRLTPCFQGNSGGAAWVAGTMPGHDEDGRPGHWLRPLGALVVKSRSESKTQPITIIAKAFKGYRIATSN